jgi:hypothetical protein
MSYKAVVTKIQTRPHPNADRIQLGLVLGYQVIVGLDTENNELGVFFPSDGQLSEVFAIQHDLVQRKNPETGAREGGFFAKNRRVRAQRFRGEKSYGFWCPLSDFEFTGADISSLKVGDEFDSLNDVPICNKYITRATAQAQRGRKLRHRRETKTFPMMFDVKQFRRWADRIPLGSLITITEKMHGTSHRLGHVYDESERKDLLGRLYRLLKRKPLFRTGYRYLSGTRRVILEKWTGDSWYGDEAFRVNATKKLMDNLHKGEMVYGEIVGWAGAETPIMPPHDTTQLRDKSIRKIYGDKIHYTYGCPAGTQELYIYRITMSNEDGVVTELPWWAVKRRANELGVKHVVRVVRPFFVGTEDDREKLKSLIESLVNGASQFGNHIREGVAIRVEHEKLFDILKAKSFTFGLLEGYLKEDESVIDREEAA